MHDQIEIFPDQRIACVARCRCVLEDMCGRFLNVAAYHRDGVNFKEIVVAFSDCKMESGSHVTKCVMLESLDLKWDITSMPISLVREFVFVTNDRLTWDVSAHSHTSIHDLT